MVDGAQVTTRVTVVGECMDEPKETQEPRCAYCGAEEHDLAECDDAFEQALRDAEAEEEAATLAAQVAIFVKEEEEKDFQALLIEDLKALEEMDLADVDPEEYPATDSKKKGKNDEARAKHQSSQHGAFERGDQAELADRLIAKLNDKGPAIIYDDGELYRYEVKDGLWHPVSMSAQAKVIVEFAGYALAGEKKKTVRINHADIRGASRVAELKTATPGFFRDHVAHGIAFGDGFVTVREGMLRRQPHDPSNRARWGYPFPFLEEPRPERFLAFLESVFRPDADREAKIAFVQEFGGLALLGLAPTFSHCLVATSFLNAETDGQNGKSQLALILQGIMPEGSVSNTRPQDFENEYRRAGLAGKLLNCVGEMPEGEILESASFKAIITGDKIEGRPIRESPFTFYPRAAHYYACNQPPGTADFSRAFFRRFVFLTFNRVFRETDPDFVRDIGRTILEEEQEILPSWFLAGAARALKNGRYTPIPSSDAAIKKWREKVDQVALFVDEMTRPAKSEKPGKKSDWIGAFYLYNAYATWTKDTGHAKLASNKFGERMKQLGRKPIETKYGSFYPVKLL